MRLVARDARDAAVLLRGRRGSWRHSPSFRVAGVALGDIHLRFRVAGVALMGLGWVLVARDARDAAALLRGRRGTWRHPPSLCVASVAPPSFSSGRRGTFGTGLGLEGRLGPVGRP